MTDDAVLVTGALGLVGSAVVRRLADQGARVVATDLDVPANRGKARALARSGGVELRWADLTHPGAVDELVRSVDPGAVVHLAAIIPPLCYASRELARQVNVGATASLLRAASRLSSPARFVLASSVAVYGARNPHRSDEVLTAATPLDPCDLYGGHKVEAERAVTASGLEWVILRLGGVMTPELRFDGGLDMVYFEGLLPTDGRIQTVDVRDVACAFASAVTTGATREVFLIGGDRSHRVRQRELGSAMSEAAGLAGALPQGRPGDPADDQRWFTTDFMDTDRAQQVLSFQHHSLADLMAEARAAIGWRRAPIRMIAPLVGVYLRSKAPYHGRPGVYADPWGAIERKWGDPSRATDPVGGTRCR